MSVRFASPTELVPKPDIDDLEYGKFFTDHMLKISWHKSLGGWQKPEITPIENIGIHPAAKVLQYAVEVSKTVTSYARQYASMLYFLI